MYAKESELIFKWKTCTSGLKYLISVFPYDFVKHINIGYPGVYQHGSVAEKTLNEHVDLQDYRDS